jgi:alanine racemase
MILVMIKQTKVRIGDVARAAGVSPTAVSFAFNNPHQLNPQTVSRILEVAEQLGYSPNPHARALLSKSVGVIGVLTPQSLPSIFANPFFATFYEGVGRVCDEHSLSLLTISSIHTELSTAGAKAPVDGLIVIGLDERHPEVALLQRRNIPFVIVDGKAVNAPSVNVDDEGGAHSAADYLIAQGHRDIALLTFETDYNTTHPDKVYGVGAQRLQGYKRAFEERDVPWQDQRLIPTVASRRAGEEAFIALWEQGARPTAILAVADIIAVGVMQAAAAAGVRIPGDLAVIGFDNIPESAWTAPPLTTVHQPIVEKGEAAAQTLLARIDNVSLAEPHLYLPTRLLLRQST